jgi:type I restriction enzyme S subunit
MKANWQIKKLGEILKLEYGKPLSKNDRGFKGKYPVYGANGIKSRCNSFYFAKPSIIVGRKGSAGELHLSENKFWPLDVTYFVTFDENKYDLKFLYNLLTTLELPKLAKGVKPGINRNEVYLIEVGIPPFPEQKRIVEILDDVFEKLTKAKENAEKNLQNSKELFKSYLQSIFTNPSFELKKIKDIAEIKGGKRIPQGKKLEYEDTGYPYIRVADFNDNGSIDIDDIRYITKDIFEQIKRYTISSKDLYISIAGTIGKTGIISEELEGANLTENACKLVFKNGIDNKYVYFFTKSREFTKQAGLNTRTTAMPKLALSRLGSIEIPFPKSLSEQKSIVKKLDALSGETKKLEGIYKQKLLALEELKKSVLASYFAKAS